MANIISNLMENAVKYSGSSVSIRVECRLQAELTLKVSDDGIGIPVSEQDGYSISFTVAATCLTVPCRASVLGVELCQVVG